MVRVVGCCRVAGSDFLFLPPAVMPAATRVSQAGALQRLPNRGPSRWRTEIYAAACNRLSQPDALPATYFGQVLAVNTSTATVALQWLVVQPSSGGSAGGACHAGQRRMDARVCLSQTE